MKLVRGSSIRTIALLANIVVLFLLMPFIIGKLGNEQYGLWTLVGSLTSYYFLLDLGVSQAVSRYIAQAIGQNNLSEIKAIVTNAIRIFSIMGMCAMGVTVLLMGLFFFLIPTELLLVSQILLLFVGIEFAFSLPLKTYQGVLKAHLDFDVLSAFELVKLFVRSIAIVVLLNLGLGIISLGLVNLLCNMTLYYASFAYAKKKYGVMYDKDLIQKNKMTDLLHFSKFVFGAQIGDLLRFRIDSFVITGFLGLAPVTVYAIAIKIINYFMELMFMITGVFQPLFSQYEGAKDLKNLKDKYLLAVRISTLFSVFFAGNLILFGHSFITRWMGAAYLEAYPVLFILTIGFFFALSQSAGIGVLQSINKHKYFTYLNLVEGIANLSLTLMLVKPFGLIGVAIGTAAPMIVTKIFFQPLYVCKNIGINITYFIKETIGVMIASISFYTIIYVVLLKVDWIFNISYPRMFILSTNIGIFFFIFSYFFVLNKNEKFYFYKIFQKLIKIDN